MKFCKHCGQQMEDQDVFCMNCGKKDESIGAAVPSVPEEDIEEQYTILLEQEEDDEEPSAKPQDSDAKISLTKESFAQAAGEAKPENLVSEEAVKADAGNQTSGSFVQADAGNRTSGSFAQRDAGNRTSGSFVQTDAGNRTSGSFAQRDAGNQTSGSFAQGDAGKAAKQSPVEDVFCPYCGTKNDSQTVYCQNCGKPIGQESKAKTALPGLNLKKFILPAAAVAGVLVIGFIGIKLIGGLFGGKEAYYLYETDGDVYMAKVGAKKGKQVKIKDLSQHKVLSEDGKYIYGYEKEKFVRTNIKNQKTDKISSSGDMQYIGKGRTVGWNAKDEFLIFDGAEEIASVEDITGYSLSDDYQKALLHGRDDELYIVDLQAKKPEEKSIAEDVRHIYGSSADMTKIYYITDGNELFCYRNFKENVSLYEFAEFSTTDTFIDKNGGIYYVEDEMKNVISYATENIGKIHYYDGNKDTVIVSNGFFAGASDEARLALSFYEGEDLSDYLDEDKTVNAAMDEADELLENMRAYVLHDGKANEFTWSTDEFDKISDILQLEIEPETKTFAWSAGDNDVLWKVDYSKKNAEAEELENGIDGVELIKNKEIYWTKSNTLYMDGEKIEKGIYAVIEMNDGRLIGYDMDSEEIYEIKNGKAKKICEYEHNFAFFPDKKMMYFKDYKEGKGGDLYVVTGSGKEKLVIEDAEAFTGVYPFKIRKEQE